MNLDQKVLNWLIHEQSMIEIFCKFNLANLNFLIKVWIGKVGWHTKQTIMTIDLMCINQLILSITITRRHVTRLLWSSAFLSYSDTIAIQFTLLTPSHHLKHYFVHAHTHVINWTCNKTISFIRDFCMH